MERIQKTLLATKDSEPRHQEDMQVYQKAFDLFEDLARSYLSPLQLDRLFQLTWQTSPRLWIDRPVVAQKLGLTTEQMSKLHLLQKKLGERRSQEESTNLLTQGASLKQREFVERRRVQFEEELFAGLQMLPEKILTAKQREIYAHLGGRPLEPAVEPVEANPPTS